MDDNRVLIIGHQGPFRLSQFWNPPNLGEFSSVIWYPKSLPSETQQGHARTIIRRFGELESWIKEGHSLVIIGAPVEDHVLTYVENNQRHGFDPLKATEIFRDISFHQTSGTLTEYCGPTSLYEVLSQFSGSQSYDAVLPGKELIPLFRVSKSVPGSDQLVGAYRKFGDGVIVYLPPSLATNPKSGDFYIYHLAAASILDLLEAPAQEDEVDWLDYFQTASERIATESIRGARIEIKQIETKIASLQQGVSTERLSKLLFTASGDLFAAAVAAALRELGLIVIEGPRQRADLIAWDGRRLAAIEAKGLEGPAREKNVGQVNRWTADLTVALASDLDEIADDPDLVMYRNKLSELGISTDQSAGNIECKGIAILGTFRKIPLDERPESFDDPVLRVIVRSEVCALTGLQLFSLVHEVRATPSRGKQIIDELFETNGVLEAGRSWQTHLRKITA